MGPTIILDKSTFQALSRREHLFLHKHFIEGLTAILAIELLGDLAKKPKRGKRSAQTQVAEIAGKFGGSGPVMNVDYLTLVYNSLMGNPVPMEGGIIPENVRRVRANDGSLGAIIDLSPFNYALLRWSRGEFSRVERELSTYWRHITRSISVESFRDQLTAHKVILPHVGSKEELIATVDALLATVTLQEVWLEWLLNQLSLPSAYETTIRTRWRLSSRLFLRDFGPYAWYVLRVLLTLLIATRHKLVEWKATNLLDVQYLYYFPFCMVFASSDQIHQFLAPLLMREDQDFVNGQELKTDLRRLAEDREKLGEHERAMFDFALGSYPPPAKNSIIHMLWKKHMRPWRPGSGNRITRLTEPDQERAIRIVTEMFREVEGDSYFDDRPE